MKINYLIAFHTLLSACAGISLAAVLFLGFFRLEHKQQLISADAVALNDLLRVEESYRQWLIMMDLVLGNEQTYLARGAKRQALFFLELVKQIANHSLADSVQTDIEKISQQLSPSINNLDFILGGEAVEPDAVMLFDAQSVITLELFLQIKHHIQQSAQLNKVVFEKQRANTIKLSIIYVAIFMVFVVSEWIVLSLYLVRPVQRLSKSVRLAQQQKHHFEYANHSGPIEIKTLAEDARLFILQLEEFADHAQKANSAKSEFLSVMSHEIRTPLNAIIGFSELLTETDLGQKQREYIDLVNKSGNSLLELINDILDFSKIEAGKMELSPVWFDIYELLITVLSSNRHACSKKSISLEHFIAPGLPRYCYGDEQKIRQILYNLLNNAIKFTNQGSVTLNLSIEQFSQQAMVVNISIKDTGIGIAKDKQEQLFNPFVQEDASTTRKYGGTGLGLAIVKKMSVILGGGIDLHSEQGLGTEFNVQLPLALVAEDAEQKEITPDVISVVVKEDDPELALQLKVLGYTVKVIPAESVFNLLELNMDEDSRLLLFCQDCYEQAWTCYQQKMQKNLNIPIAYCSKDLRVSDMPCILMNQDVIDTVQQINMLINTDIKLLNFDHLAQGFQVLVVEDNPVNLLMTQNILKNMGIKSQSAVNGKQALELYDSVDFSLILMDCQMPVMDGFAATQEIRKRELQKGTHIPIIALTANAFKEDQEACATAGMDDYLSKPFKKKQLLEVMSPWLKLDDQKPVSAVNNEKSEDILDASLIQELREMDSAGSNEFIRQISVTYFDNANQIFQQIDKALVDNAMDVIIKGAHQLKSSSMNVAAKRLSSLFISLEAVAKQSDHQAAVDLWKSIEHEYNLVNKAYKELLDDKATL